MSKLLPLSPEILRATEDGLIFSAPLVPRVLDGSKTVTRRMSRKWLKRKKGDLLFVRENWRLAGYDMVIGHDCRLLYEADGASLIHKIKGAERVAWLARESDRRVQWRHKHGGPGAPQDCAPLRPSLLLPRWASRCVLRLTEDPRLEHVQEITEEDAKREGVEPLFGEDIAAASYRVGFRTVWRKLHTKDGERWEENPTVIVLPFERIA